MFRPKVWSPKPGNQGHGVHGDGRPKSQLVSSTDWWTENKGGSLGEPGLVCQWPICVSGGHHDHHEELLDAVATTDANGVAQCLVLEITG